MPVRTWHLICGIFWHGWYVECFDKVDMWNVLTRLIQRSHVTDTCQMLSVLAFVCCVCARSGHFSVRACVCVRDVPGLVWRLQKLSCPPRLAVFSPPENGMSRECKLVPVLEWPNTTHAHALPDTHHFQLSSINSRAINGKKNVAVSDRAHSHLLVARTPRDLRSTRTTSKQKTH